MPEIYLRKPNAVCAICAKAVYRRPGVIERNKGCVYCSMACYGVSCRRGVPCLVCGKLILSGLHRRTCSKTCSNKHRAGIKYKIGRPRDKVTSERALKSRLLAERGTLCERCGYNKKEILQVHHKDGIHSNNNIGNLELICPNCHYEEHYLEKSWLKK